MIRNYKPLIAKTGPGETVIDSKTGEIRHDWVNLFSRTFAHAVAGNTTSMNFNNATKVFSLIYTPNPSIQAATEIRLMRRIHYPDDYEVVVIPEKAAKIFRAWRNENAVFVRSWYEGEIEVRVQPKGFEEQKGNATGGGLTGYNPEIWQYIDEVDVNYFREYIE
jgi:hypothetical protein